MDGATEERKAWCLCDDVMVRCRLGGWRCGVKVNGVVVLKGARGE